MRSNEKGKQQKGKNIEGKKEIEKETRHQGGKEGRMKERRW